MLVGLAGDWVALRLPEAVHPWQLHNLANWMLDCPGVPAGTASGIDGPGVIAESAGGPEHPAYWLVADPELPDSLCGWDDTGQGWTVQVPGNDIVRDEDVPVPRSISAPSGHGDWRTAPVLLEETGTGMNEGNASTFGSRARLRDRSTSFVF